MISRISGCQMVHSESQMVSYLHLISLFLHLLLKPLTISLMTIPTIQRYLCNWHHAMIYKAEGTVGLKRPLMKDTIPASPSVKRAKVAQSHPATQTAAGSSNAYPISGSGNTWAFPYGYPHHYPQLPSAYASATMK